MFWYIDRDSDVILITSKKWRKASLEHVTRKNTGEDTKPFCFRRFSWSFSWSGFSGLRLSCLEEKSGSDQESGDLWGIEQESLNIKSDWSSVLEAVGVFIKIKSQVTSTLQMFTMLHVCKVLFISDQAWRTSSGPHFFLFCSWWFFICSERPFLNCDWLDFTDGMNEWRGTSTLQNWTWHTNMNMKKRCIQETATV